MADPLPSRGIKPDLCWFERPRAINPSSPSVPHLLIPSFDQTLWFLFPSLLPSFFHLRSHGLRFFKDPPPLFLSFSRSSRFHPRCFLRSRITNARSHRDFQFRFLRLLLKAFRNSGSPPIHLLRMVECLPLEDNEKRARILFGCKCRNSVE